MSKHGFDRDGNAIIKTESTVAEMQIKGAALSTHYSVARPFSIEEFKILFLQWVIRDNITLRQSGSLRLRKILNLLNVSVSHVLPFS